MNPVFFYEYLNTNGADLFTAVALPAAEGKFPVVIHRSPYVDIFENAPEGDIAERLASDHAKWIERGYAVILQHCRGRGKSSGDCIPYINERSDGLALQEWVRRQPFYNGEIYLVGESYGASVHYTTAPFADDIKGAVLLVQDPERYNCNYRNGFYKVGLHGGWYVAMYKAKSIREKNYDESSYNMLPLSDFSKTVFGEKSADFDEILRHPSRDDDFWNTHTGGSDARDAARTAGIPILFVAGFYDIFTGGMFEMWRSLDADTKKKCAMLTHPYGHNGHIAAGEPVDFEGGAPADTFGNYVLRWIEAVRGKEEPFITTGKMTYYKLFGNEWCTDDFETSGNTVTFPIGTGETTYAYDPADPASFKGGLSANFGGNEWQDIPGERSDIITYYTPVFEKDTFVKGKIGATLAVRSDCEDTCFYMRLSLVKEDGDYGLRDDITQISNFVPDYVPGEEAEVHFTFDDHAFVIHKGERIRIDVSSSAYPLYVRHTNNRGLFSEQTTLRVANNTVIADKSTITIPVE